VILTPYQHHGHGCEYIFLCFIAQTLNHPILLAAADLYKAIYQYILTQPAIAELTVEDPAEAFEDLRDRNDLRMLLSNQRFIEEGFGGAAVSHGGGRVRGVGRAGKSGRGGNATMSAKGKMGPPADKAWVEKWRSDLKIAGVNTSLTCLKGPRLIPFHLR
jgi:histone acetyltransferase 1